VKVGILRTGKASAREASSIPKNDGVVVLAIDDGRSYTCNPRTKRKGRHFQQLEQQKLQLL